MTTSDKLREIAAKWKLTQADLEIWKAERRIVQTPIPEFLSDLTALISEDYYPKEFVEWMGREGIYKPINRDYWYYPRSKGRVFNSLDELFNYWKENEQ